MSWIKIDRRLLDWEWFSGENMLKAWIWLLLSANYEDKRWNGITIRRGQMVLSLSRMADSLGISVQQARTILMRLKSTGEITSESTNRYTIVTISKYDTYQESDKVGVEFEQQAEQQSNNKQSTSQATTTKEYKEIKNIKKESIEKELPPLPATLEERKISFAKSMEKFVGNRAGQYPKQMVDNFVAYWTEHNPNGRKLRFEMEKVFDAGRRLATWASKDYNKATSTKRTDPVLDCNSRFNPDDYDY